MGLYGALCDAHGGGLCPEAMGEEEGAHHKESYVNAWQKSRGEWRVESGGCRDGERLLSDKVTAGVDAEEDEQQDSEAP